MVAVGKSHSLAIPSRDNTRDVKFGTYRSFSPTMPRYGYDKICKIAYNFGQLGLWVDSYITDCI